MIVLVALALFAIRVMGPSDLMDNDQLKPAHYVHDVVLNGNWIVQRDTSGDIASKPPMQVWLASVASLPFGRAHWYTLALPSLLGVILTALVASWFAARVMPSDPKAPLLAGLMVLLCMMGAKQAALVRTDALFGGTVALCALLAWTSSRGRTPWVGFWAMAAVSTLTKGPIGVLIACFGLLARPWETGAGQKKPLLPHAIGVALFVAIVGLWVLASYLDSGQAFIDKVLGKELVGHAVASGKGDPPFVGFYKSPAYFLWWYAPAAPLALFAVVAWWRRTTGETRALVRFLALWMLGGLALFALSPHQRADLLTPIWAPCGALAGCLVAGCVRTWPRWRKNAVIGVAIAGTLGGVYWHRHHAVLDDKHIVRAKAIEGFFAGEPSFERASATAPSHGYRSLNAHSYIDFVMGKMQRRLSADEALEWIAESPLNIVMTNGNDADFEDAVRERFDGVRTSSVLASDGFVVRFISADSEKQQRLEFEGMQELLRGPQLPGSEPEPE